MELEWWLYVRKHIYPRLICPVLANLVISNLKEISITGAKGPNLMREVMCLGL